MKNYTGNFFDDVYAITQLIPEGRITTYGAIAAYLSTPKSAQIFQAHTSTLKWM
jgi:methylated-DNA-protein-cysteine methyltransferase-like protein